MSDAEQAARHVVMFSGGIGSWMAAKRVAAKHGTEGLTLLFADTKEEDADTYRFLREAAANVGGRLVEVSDGRRLWDVYRDVRLIGSSRIAPCSHILKQEQTRKWVNANCGPDAIIYVGIDWTEAGRLKGVRKGWAPYYVEAPLCEKPLLYKQDMHDAAKAEGIAPQRLYLEGFPHANCGGFCVRAGQEGFAHLLRARPDTYARHEAEEEKMRRYLGKDVAIMRHRSGPKEGQALTMHDFRIGLTCGAQPELDGFGGCGCFVDSADE